MIKVFIFTLAGLALIIVLKQYRPEYAFLTRLAVISSAAVVVVALASEILSKLNGVADFGSFNSQYVLLGLKVLGISLVTQTAADVCKDCGETALSTTVEFIGRVAVIGIVFPVIEKLIEISISLIMG